MASDEMIHKVSRLICDGDPEGMGYAQTHNIASDLAERGLLAPAPLREEWGVQSVGWKGRARTYPAFNETDARNCDWGESPVRRYVTDWEAVE